MIAGRRTRVSVTGLASTSRRGPESRKPTACGVKSRDRCCEEPVGLAQRFAIENPTGQTMLGGDARRLWNRMPRQAAEGPTPILESERFRCREPLPARTMIAPSAPPTRQIQRPRNVTASVLQSRAKHVIFSGKSLDFPPGHQECLHAHGARLIFPLWIVRGSRTTSGQAITIPVRHEDGRRGVYRELKTPLTEVDIRRFRRELRLLSQRVQHQSIVTLFDWAADWDAHWYISERGDPFPRWWRRKKSELIKDPRALVDCAVSVLHDLSSALAVCHANGIVP